MNVAGLVVLSVGVVGYVITDIILQDSAWPSLASLLWIALFWVYVVLVAIETVGDIKVHKRSKRAAAAVAKHSEDEAADGVEQNEKKQMRKIKK